MSCNEWEKGTIVIPTAQWAGVKKTIREACAAAQLHDFNLAVKLVEAVKTKNKGKRGVNWPEELRSEADRTVRSTGWYAGNTSCYPFKLVGGRFYELEDRLLVRDADTGKGKLRAPLKKDFCTINSKTVSFDAAGCGTLWLNDKKHSIEWRVSENNHAVDDARESFVGRLLFNQLDKVKWGRGSGGAIFGNNEYHREAGEHHPGGGGSYISKAYGPLGDKGSLAMHGIRLRSRPARPGVR